MILGIIRDVILFPLNQPNNSDLFSDSDRSVTTTVSLLLGKQSINESRLDLIKNVVYIASYVPSYVIER